jgi:hypothetical protein
MHEGTSNNPKSCSTANNLKLQQQQVSKHKSPVLRHQSGLRQHDPSSLGELAVT